MRSAVVGPSKRTSPRSKKIGALGESHRAVDALLDQDHRRPRGVDRVEPCP